MVERMKKTAASLFGKQLVLRVRLFNVLALTGVLFSLWSAFAAFSIYKEPQNGFVYIFYLFLSAGLLCYAAKTGKYRVCAIISVFAVFLVGFPIFFFQNGTYTGSIPFYFIFAVTFTAFLLEGRKVLFFCLLELAVYIGICLFSYWYLPAPGHTIAISSVISGFTAVSVALAITMFLQFRLYSRQNTELEAARKKLAEENAALEKINQLKAEFLANISHELKTPLTVVSGYAQTTASQLRTAGAEEDPLVDKMKLISSEAERLALMVNQILDVTKIEENRMCLEPKPSFLDEIIHGTIRAHYPILNKNGNSLMIQMEDNLPPVLADAARISQVLVNLISNAIRFTSAGTITVSARHTGDAFVAVMVSDTGRGIPPEIQPHLFERYKSYSVQEANTGTGLGLYICKHIISEHGGSISIESETQKGTTVCFTLPLAQTGGA